jgi:hypothetical protein
MNIEEYHNLKSTYKRIIKKNFIDKSILEINISDKFNSIDDLIKTKEEFIFHSIFTSLNYSNLNQLLVYNFRDLNRLLDQYKQNKSEKNVTYN